jgi:Na+/H+ antiporter NhaD/arsenite permease-like protein
MAILAGLLGAFLLADWPREVSAMAAGGLVLLSRSSRSRAILGLVDWPLLVLFAGLFVVNAALAKTGLPAASLEWLRGAGAPLEEPAWLFGTSVVLSNVVSNVPAAMLLLPAATHPMAGTILALATTFAGNLFIAGSVANLIVAECARQGGVEVGWREHFRTGFPVCAGSLAAAGGWLWLLAR